MKQHTLNHLPMNSQTLYTIYNLDEINFSYKLVPLNINLIEGLESKYYADLMNIAYKIGSRTNGPAVIITKNNKKHIAIPTDKTFETEIFLGKTGKVKLELPKDSPHYHLKFNNCSDEEYNLIEKFLEFSLRKQIKEKYNLIEDGAGKLFPKQPLLNIPNANIDVLEGFSFRIVPEGKKLAHICIDVTHRNISKFPISESVTPQNKERVKGRYTNSTRGRKALLKFGDNWFPIEILGFGESISTQMLFDKNLNERTVEEYTITETKHHRNKITALNPAEVCVVYCYPGKRKQMEPRYCASSLVYLLYTTKDEEMRSVHSTSILKTYRRFKNINQIVFDYFKNLKYNGQLIKFDFKPKQDDLQVLKSKDLLFANGHKLSLYDYKTGLINQDLGKKRRLGILKNGVFGKDYFDPQYLFVPKDSVDYEVIDGVFDGFKRDFSKKLKDLADTFRAFTKVIQYDYNPNLPAKRQVDLIKEAALSEGVGEGCAIFVMPDRPQFSKKSNSKNDESLNRLHNCLKKEFFPLKLKFQCVAYSELERHYEGFMENNEFVYKVVNNAYGFDNQLFYLALEYLNLNLMFPYALAQNLNYDIYVGIDVHDRYAGFSFLYKNAGKIYLKFKDVPLKDKHSRAEKLTAEQILEVVEPTLREHIKEFCPNPNGMVLLRDGNSHGGEEKAVLQIIDRFSSENLLNKDTFKWAVVDLHKNSAMPLRVSLSTNPERKYELPTIGTHKRLGRNFEEAFMFNTGFPFEIRGSVKPLHYTFVAGNANFNEILEDLFSQTMLAFSAPDRPNSLPVIIKLLDFYLGSWAHGEKNWNNQDEETNLLPLDFRQEEVFEEVVNDDSI